MDNVLEFLVVNWLIFVLGILIIFSIAGSILFVRKKKGLLSKDCNNTHDDVALEEPIVEDYELVIFDDNPAISSNVRWYEILKNIINEDDSITEVMFNGFDKIYIEKEGRTVRYSEKIFNNIGQFRNFASQIARQAGREITEGNPIVSVFIKQDGSRATIIWEPVALNGPYVSIRRFPKVIFTMDMLVENFSISKEAAEFLKDKVAKKHSILVSGGSSTGKTSLLNALSQFIESDVRTVLIEDVAELTLNVENLVRLQAKPPRTPHSNDAITIRDLIKASLRLNAGRIIVGEVRSGEEAIDMVQAMSTGHAGSLSTLHADSAIGALHRLENLVLMSKENWPVNTLRQQISTSVDFIVQLARMNNETRKVIEIVQVKSYNDEIEKYVLETLFTFDACYGLRTIIKDANDSTEWRCM